MLAPFDKERPELPFSVREKVETEIKYEGYIARQQAQVNEMLRLEGKAIPNDIDYSAVYGLRLEAVEKLNKIRPANIGQAPPIFRCCLYTWRSRFHSSLRKSDLMNDEY